MSNMYVPSHTIQALYEQFLFKNKLNFDQDLNSGLSMIFTVKVRCDNHGYDGNTKVIQERSYLKYVHYILHHRHMVFEAISDEDDITKVPLDEFKNTSNHNSCWRSGFDGITKTYFDAAKHCYGEDIPEHLRRSPANSGVVMNLCSGWYGTDLVRYAKIEFKPIDSGDPYRKYLTKVTPVKFKVTIEK